MKRFLSLFLSFAIAAGSFSAAFAAESENAEGSVGISAGRPISTEGFIVADKLNRSVSDEDESSDDAGDGVTALEEDSAYLNGLSSDYAEEIKEAPLDALDASGTFTVAIDENGSISEAKDDNSTFNVTFNYNYNGTTSSEYENGKYISDTLLEQQASGSIKLCQITAVSKGVSARVKIPGTFKASIDGAETDVVVVAVRSSAFEGSLLKSVELPDTVTQIGASAFRSCSSLESAVLNFRAPSKEDAGKEIAPQIGDSAFEGSAVKEVKIYTSDEGKSSTAGNRALSFGSSVFKDCKQLSGFTAEKAAGVSAAQKLKFGDSTFENCESLVSFVFPENVSSVGKYTFENCSALETFQLSSDYIKEIKAADWFNRCQSLTRFIEPLNNSKYTVIDDCLVYNKTTLVLYPPARVGTSYTVPESITKVGDFGFGSNNLTPKEKTGEYEQASLSLQSLSFEGNGVIMGERLFVNNKTIKTVSFSGSVGNIGESCFENAVNLSSFTYKNDWTKCIIYKNAFKGCTSLSQITLKYWGEIKESAFQGCTGLKTLNLSYIGKLGNYVFKDCTSLETLNMGYSVGTVGNELFMNCTSLINVDISVWGRNDPEDVTNNKYFLTDDSTFGTGIFEECSNLQTCVVPDLLDGLSSRTFYNCINLRSVTGSDNEFFIGTIVYDNDTGYRVAKGYKGGNFMSFFNSECFYNCGNLEEVISPRFLVGVKAHAFYNCKSLKEMPFTRSVLEEFSVANAFEGCTALTIKAPEESGMYNFGINNGIKTVAIEDDMTDEEFAVWSDEKGNGSYTVTVGYIGGFKELEIKVPADSYNYRIDGVSTTSAKTGWIDCAWNKNAGMKTVLKKLTLQNISVGVGTGDTTGDLYKNGQQQFKGATSLEEVVWLENPNSSVSKDLEICADAFSGCTSLKNVVFSDDIVIIDKSAFYNCKLLEVLKFPKKLLRIGETAFSGCKKLMKVKFYAGLSEINNEAFLNCADLTTITLPGGTSVGTNAFKGCTAINRVIAPSTVKIATSDDPFTDGTEGSITIVTDSASTIVAYAANKGFKVEYASFADGVNASEIKIKGQVIDSQERIASVTKNGSEYNNIKTSEPEEKSDTYEDVSYLYKDYTVGNTEDYVSEGDVLEISLAGVYRNLPFITINDKKVAEVINGVASYTVGENEHISIKTADENLQYITIPDNIIVKRGKEILENYAIINAGDVLTISASPENGYGVSTLKVNGIDIKDGGEYTVKEGENVFINADFEKLAYHVTIPERVFVYKNGELVISGAEVKAGDELEITAYPPSGDYVISSLTVNGDEIENGSVYTVLPYTNVVISVRFYAENATGGYIYGDATGNKKIETTDANAILSRVQKGDKSLTAVEKDSALTQEQKLAVLDVDGDGVITASDAAHVRKRALDPTYVFPVER